MVRLRTGTDNANGELPRVPKIFIETKLDPPFLSSDMSTEQSRTPCSPTWRNAELYQLIFLY